MENCDRQEYTYYLPEDGLADKPKKYTVNNNSLIIIGANGSGKSYLGAWLEKTVVGVHRIGAQRSLSIGKNIQLRPFEVARNLLDCGREDFSICHDSRWGWNGFEYDYTSRMLNDYEFVLSALWAQYNDECRTYTENASKCEKQKLHQDPPGNLILDKFVRIWDSVFPHVKLSFEKDQIKVTNSKGRTYDAYSMSDGERVVLYLIAQALVVSGEVAVSGDSANQAKFISKNKIIIVDEPEIHLHRSIVNRLWTAIEKERKDCLFIYITHDTEFAANHTETKKIWVKEFDGCNWDLEDISDCEFPEQLLLKILGNRMPVLFVEGESGSYDTRLYSLIYDDYYVVPCGSCESVIENTKAMKNIGQLNNLQCYGIVDRDYRTDQEVRSLEEKGVFVLDVAEVENLFLIPDVLKMVNEIMALQTEESVENVKKYVVDTKYRNEIDKQIRNAVVREIKFKVNGLNEDECGNKCEDICTKMISMLSKENCTQVYESICHKYQEALDNKDYMGILRIYNQKGIVQKLGAYFHLENSKTSYCDFVLRQLQGNCGKELKEIFVRYLPNLREI